MNAKIIKVTIQHDLEELSRNFEEMMNHVEDHNFDLADESKQEMHSKLITIVYRLDQFMWTDFEIKNRQDK